MEAAATANGADDGKIALLRETTPFGEASGAFLARVAAIARPARYGAGKRIYAAGDAADDIVIVASGRVEHVMQAEVKRLGRGGVVGWAGLLQEQIKHLATVTATEPTEVLRLNTEALVGLLESEP